MRFEFLVALRYVRAKRHVDGRGGLLSFISFISMAGITLGVAALIIVLSVVNGFELEIRSHILGVVSHAEVNSLNGNLPDWRDMAQHLQTHPEVVATAPFVQAQGMFVEDEQVSPVLVRGITPGLEEHVADFARFMRQGHLDTLKTGSFNVILGAELAKNLSVKVGDTVTLISPQGTDASGMIIPTTHAFTVSGIFSVDMYEYDEGLALISLGDAQTLYSMGNAVSGIRIKFDDLFAAPRLAREIAQKLPRNVYVSDWTMGHANFFDAVKMTKSMMFIVLLLIIAVAAFNVVSALVMAVQDKRADISILRTLGASPSSIMQIFILQGVFMGLIGLTCGVGSGVFLALNLGKIVPFIENILGFQFLSKGIYLISELPSELLWSDVMVITLVAFMLTVISTLYPSWRASRLNPAEALRYE